jgi:glycosyltransferase involved in cell wall biosynthesis
MLAKRRVGRVEPHASACARWAAAALVAMFGLAGPYFHWAYESFDRVPRFWARGVVLFGLVAWFAGRPAAVVLADRFRRSPPSTSRKWGVSVVVPCHNAAAKIERTVDSILEQRFRPIEIILVENNSTDETWEVLLDLERRHPEVRAFWIPPDPSEYAASIALNVAVERAAHPVIMRLDDDTYLAEGAIESAVEALTKPNTVAVACNLRVANPESSVWTRLQSLEYLLAMEVERRSQVLLQSVLVCSGGMQVFLTNVIRRSGGYVALPKEVSEDLDMTMKAHRLGLVAVAPESIGFTEVPVTLRALVRQRRRWAISGTVGLWLHRHGIIRHGYWHHGMVGFVGLPIRAIQALRDLVPVVFVIDVVLVLHDRVEWLTVLILARMTLIAAQVAIVRPSLRCKQGIRYAYLIPIFTLAYGPVLLVTRFLGTIAGVAHVVNLRRRLATLEREIVDFALPEGFELEPARP